MRGCAEWFHVGAACQRGLEDYFKRSEVGSFFPKGQEGTCIGLCGPRYYRIKVNSFNL